MDSERMSRWLTLGANLAVLTGIVLLIAELNQNDEIMRAQIRNEITQGELSLLALTAENRELVDILVRADQGEELTPTETRMYSSRSESVFRLWQNVHYQGRNGMYDEEEFSKHIQTMASVLNNSPGLVTYWCGARLVYPAAFAAEIDHLIPADSCMK